MELPRTRSTAIRRELRELYDGSPLFHKHATYLEFARHAPADINPTGQRPRPVADYCSAAAIKRAPRVIGPHMKRWSSAVPNESGVERATRLHRLAYDGLSRVAQVYWQAL